jgi:UDP-GlcNAc:undecaprenyl-phosphate GlcNAc-1-phosphate transferase
MGDTGSMFIGLMLGVMSLMAGGKLATMFLVMGLPILDAFWVIMRRILSGKSPLKGDLKHFHHRLLDLGWGQRKIMLLIYLVSLGFGVSAVFLGTREKMWALILLVLLMAIVGLFVVYKSIDLKQNK